MYNNKLAYALPSHTPLATKEGSKKSKQFALYNPAYFSTKPQVIIPLHN